jgi:hypothetical protein
MVKITQNTEKHNDKIGLFSLSIGGFLCFEKLFKIKNALNDKEERFWYKYYFLDANHSATADASSPLMIPPGMPPLPFKMISSISSLE